MSLTVAVLLACLLCFGTKIAGYLVPGSIVDGERVSRITTSCVAARRTHRADLR